MEFWLWQNVEQHWSLGAGVWGMVNVTPIDTVLNECVEHKQLQDFFRCSDPWELTASSWLVVGVLTRVVNAGLDDVIHGEATGGGLAPQLAVDLLVQHLHGRMDRSVTTRSHDTLKSFPQVKD